MTDEDDQATLFDGNEAVDIDVATDPDESKTIVTGMTVSGEETVSTGDYESYKPYQSMRLKFIPAIDASGPVGRAAVRRRALRAHRAIQRDLSTAADNRLADPSFEDWEGIEAGQGGDDD